MHTLVLLRHGKSGYPEGVDDRDRPLDARGEREAPVAGRLLAQSDALRTDPTDPKSATVDRVLVSPARRAQQTWSFVSPQLPTLDEVETIDSLYLASADELLDMVRRLPDASAQRRVLVIGHNDGLEELATTLTNTHVRLKTSTFAVITSQLPWARWAEGAANLVEVVVAR